uniref:Uncharacterized protein n=1 Tax=Pseudictyota dubia TaxID=2749911 RepID=A0A7R9WHP2_9STRA|mmetsp:Transcript_50598/g.93536  ORF Transcript_50598/g.93536 Transcript_50598/m.93536 type:complete len:439 (+) Transcript_50598:176-1492(+)
MNFGSSNEIKSTHRRPSRSASCSLLVALLALGFLPSTSAQKEAQDDAAFACTDDVAMCPDGTYVARDPGNGCQFRPCECSEVLCDDIVQECEDGSFVAPDPCGDCSFPPCPEVDPEPLGCTEDLMACPDGTYVGRDPENDCEFRPCVLCREVCPAMVQECEDGSFVVPDPCNDCAFPPCPDVDPEAVGCTEEVMECPDGSFVSRDSENNCEFMPCPPPSACGRPTDPCMDDDNWQACRDLEEAGCENIGVKESCPLQFACGDVGPSGSDTTVATTTSAPGPQDCLTDTKECPDGTDVGRDPNNDCDFLPCPSTTTTTLTTAVQDIEGVTTTATTLTTAAQESEGVTTTTTMLTTPAQGSGGVATTTTTLITPAQDCENDVEVCPDGTTVGRNPDNGCNFFSCGEEVSTLSSSPTVASGLLILMTLMISVSVSVYVACL